MLHYEMELKGGYLTKMILYRYYCQYKKKREIVNFPIFYGQYIYRCQKDHAIAFYVPLDRI